MRAADQGRRTSSSLAVRITLLVVSVAVTVTLIAGLVGVAMIRTTAAGVTRTLLTRQADIVEQQISGEEPGFRIGLARLQQVLGQQGVQLVSVNRNGVLSGDDQQAVRAATEAGAARLPAVGGISTTVTVAGTELLVEGRFAGNRGFALVASTEVGAGTGRELFRRVLLALLAGLAVAVAGGLLLARVIARPLRRTAGVARAMAGGARRLRADAGGPREVVEVAVAVNDLADALHHSESRQQSFLASVSHEMRTPLTAINGQGQALADGLVESAEMAEVGRLITAEAGRMQRLVSDLLDLARLGADDFRLEPAPADLVEVVRDAAQVWRARCAAKSIELRLELPPHPVLMTTDARRLRQVLDGLAENAWRLLSPGRPLVLALRPGPGTVRLEVRDGGPGLSPEDYAYAFESGVLHRKYRAERAGGAGLGLALAHGLVTRLGGRITAGPAPEGGLAITIELPLPPPGG